MPRWSAAGRPSRPERSPGARRRAVPRRAGRVRPGRPRGAPPAARGGSHRHRPGRARHDVPGALPADRCDEPVPVRVRRLLSGGPLPLHARRSSGTRGASRVRSGTGSTCGCRCRASRRRRSSSGHDPEDSATVGARIARPGRVRGLDRAALNGRLRGRALRARLPALRRGGATGRGAGRGRVGERARDRAPAPGRPHDRRPGRRGRRRGRAPRGGGVVPLADPGAGRAGVVRWSRHRDAPLTTTAGQRPCDPIRPRARRVGRARSGPRARSDRVRGAAATLRVGTGRARSRRRARVRPTADGHPSGGYRGRASGRSTTTSRGRIVERRSDADGSSARLRALDVRVVTMEEPAYPDRLAAIAMPPHVLYVRGAIAALSRDVRSRSSARDARPRPGADHRGTRRDGARRLPTPTVVSGLAFGIDGAAHEATLRAGGTTVAVIGGGHASLGPAAHRRLADAIVARGGRSSPSSRRTSRRRRARSRSGTGSSADSATRRSSSRRPPKSGALITASWALEQGRGCFLVPGRIDGRASAGCLAFLREFSPVAAHRDRDPAADRGPRATRGRRSRTSTRSRGASMQEPGTDRGARRLGAARRGSQP